MMLLLPNDSSAAVALSGGLLWLGFRIGFRGKMTAPVSDGRPDSKCPFALIQGEGKKKKSIKYAYTVFVHVWGVKYKYLHKLLSFCMCDFCDAGQ